MGNDQDKEKSNRDDDRVQWEYMKMETNQWEKFDKEISSIIESNFIIGKKRLIFHNQEIIVDLVSNELRKQNNNRAGQPIRRRINWNIEELSSANTPRFNQAYPSQVNNPNNNNGSTGDKADEEPRDLVDYITALTNERDNYIDENTRLKKQIYEMTQSLTEAIESRDMALITKSEVLETLKYKNEEVRRMQDLEQDLTDLKEKLESKNNEAKSLTLLNSELRIRLSTELSDMGKSLDKSEDGQSENKSHSNSPSISPRAFDPSNNNFSPPPFRSVGLRSKSISLSKRPTIPAVSSLQADLPSVNRAPSKSVSRNHPPVPGLNLSNQGSNTERKRPSGNKEASEYKPRISKILDRSSHHVPKEPDSGRSTDLSRSARSSNNSTPKLNGNSNEGSLPMRESGWKQRDDAKEKLLKAENRCKSIEGELEIEKLKVANLKKELLGRDLEIELLRNQKVSLKDELNEQLVANQSISEKLESKSDKISKLESKLLKLKGRFRTKSPDSLEQPSESDTEDSETIFDDTQEEIKKLEEELEISREEYANLQDSNNKLQESISTLVEKISINDKKIDELENSLAQAQKELKDKEKEISNLKNSNGSKNPKLFKMMAEELQIEKAKALTLNNEVKQLTQELKTLKESSGRGLPNPYYNTEQSPEEKYKFNSPTQRRKIINTEREEKILPSTTGGASPQQQQQQSQMIKGDLGLSDDQSNDTTQYTDKGDLSD